MDRKIPLEKGQMEWLNKPSDIVNITKNTELSKVLGQGAQGKAYKICIDKLCKYEFVLKEMELSGSSYPDDDYPSLYPDDDYPYAPENIEIKILKILNEFIYTGVTPHILLYLGDFDYAKHRYLLMEKADYTLDNLKTFL